MTAEGLSFALALLTAGTTPAATPGAAASDCLRLSRAGTRVQGRVKICPGRYRVADRNERGVIVVVAAGTHLDLAGVTLESGDSVPAEFAGIGIVSRGVDSVSITGGRVRGYRYGVRLEGGAGHRISRINLSGSRRQALRSTPTRFDEADWLDIFRPEIFERYGAGLYLKGTRGVEVSGVIARDGQNGIGLFGTREARLADNDVSGNSGWGIHLWESSRNMIVRNRAGRNVRCESAAYRRGCDSAALLLRQRSDSNLVAENDLTWSGDGFFLSGHRPLLQPSVGNLVVRNDASHAWHNGFEATFSGWNTFLDNRADSCDYGFWLGFSRATVVRGNRVIDSRSAAVAIEHGGENELAGNILVGGPVGIHLFAPREDGDPSTAYRVDGNVLTDLERAIVLQGTTRSRITGNLLDHVGDGLVADERSGDAEVRANVFLSATRWILDVVRLEAGGNYWGWRDEAGARRQMRGEVSLQPFRLARDAGY